MTELEQRYLCKIPYAEVHLHLGGAVMPRILWEMARKDNQPIYMFTDKETGRERYFYKDANGNKRRITLPFEAEVHGCTPKEFMNYHQFEQYFRRQREDLDDYLKMHTLVEYLQTKDRLRYLIHRVIRGAYLYENITYLELRYCPYSRTNHKFSEAKRIKQMAKIVDTVDEEIQKSTIDYPIIVKQILCLHAAESYSRDVNEEILELARKGKKNGKVIGIDVAGGEVNYRKRMDELVSYFKIAKKDYGLNTTAHLMETEDLHEKDFEKFLPYIDRIGHGIQIPLTCPWMLKEMQQNYDTDFSFEICPTSYLKTKSLDSLRKLNCVFDSIKNYGFKATLCTDNGGMHMSRLREEYEKLQIHNVRGGKQNNGNGISFLEELRRNGFDMAFGLDDNLRELFKGSNGITDS
jgi:adenosine deaminase